MFGYIYKTTNLSNNKIYIGQKIGNFNKNYYGSGKILNRAIKKYGVDNFKLELIYECDDKDELDIMERYYIYKFNSSVEYNNYNIANGGHGDNGIKGKTYDEYYGIEKSMKIKNKFNRNGQNNSMFGKKHSKETKDKIRKKSKRSYVEIYGEERANEILEKKRISMSGKKHSKETKEKMRKSQLKYYENNPDRQKGKNNGNYGKKHKGLNEGRKHTEKSKKKMSESAKLRKRQPHTEETKLKIKLALKKFHGNK